MKKYVLQSDQENSFQPSIDYKNDLNQEQYEVVMNGDGPVLVLAGAGSGKTRTLIYRVAYLIEKGVHPSQLLLMTFTNKASRSMMIRIEQLLKIHPQGLLCGTFHHAANRIMRMFAEEIGYKKDFVILDEDDSKELIKSCVLALNVNVKSKRYPTAKVLRNVISFSKNSMRSLEDVIYEKYSYLSEFADFIVKVANKYQQKKVESGVMDYDDLLANWIELLNTSEKAREYHYKRFQYVLVDEYQDTNSLQHEIIKILSFNHNNLFVVGDDAQSIYSFRAANVQNILKFPELYPDTKIFKLETNYRSKSGILNLANQSILHNTTQFQKKLRSVDEDSSYVPAFVQVNTVYSQASFIAQRALELRDEGIPLQYIAVLFRARYQAAELELELSKRGINYVLRGGVRFFEQAHIKDVLSYLRVAMNVRDEISWKRIMQKIEGVGVATAEAIWVKVLGTISCLEQLYEKDFTKILSKRALQGFLKLLRLIKPLYDFNKNQDANPADYIDLILKSGYSQYIMTSFDNPKDRIEDLEELMRFASKMESLEKFVSDLTLREDFKGESIESDQQDTEFLILSTIHQAKGLEWNSVFLVGMQEGSFPHPKAFEDEDQLEEERRLFYVAVTRAKREVYLLHPIFRYDRTYGQTITRPSRFIKEVDSNLFELWQVDEQQNPYFEKEIYI